jgi:hypothetical protein
MALGLLITTAGIRSGIFSVIFFFNLYFEQSMSLILSISSQLMAQGLLIATDGTGSGFSLLNFIFSIVF